MNNIVNKIKKLRQLIDISMGDAKALLQENELDVNKVYQITLKKQLQPIIDATNTTIDNAKKVYDESHGNIDLTIQKIKYSKN